MEDTKHNIVYLVIKQHTSNYPNPIRLVKNQEVVVGQKYEGNEEGWNRWIYCYTIDKDLEGWVPEQILHIQNEQGYMLEDYFAKELDVTIGEQLQKLKELNGWAWVRRIDDLEEGWVPIENIKQANEY